MHTCAAMGQHLDSVNILVYVLQVDYLLNIVIMVGCETFVAFVTDCFKSHKLLFWHFGSKR